MPNDVASQATWQINGITPGNKKLRRVQTASMSDDASVEAVAEVGSAKMVAFVEHPGGIMISLEIMETKGKREVDWERIKSFSEVFSLTRQVKGGIRVQFPECMISKIDYNDESDGKTSYTVEICALERKRL